MSTLVIALSGVIGRAKRQENPLALEKSKMFYTSKGCIEVKNLTKKPEVE